MNGTGRSVRRGPRRQISRRELLRLAALAAAGWAAHACRGDDDSGTGTTVPPTATPAELMVSSVPGYDDPMVWADRSLTVTSWGGDYQDAQQRAIFEPFQRLTGASIEVESTDIIELRQQVEDEDVSWDVCDVLTEDVLPLANLGVLEALDYNVIDATAIYDEIRMEHGVGSSYYSTLLAYRSDRWPDLPPPSGWPDFWDVQRYPGSRGLHRQAQGTLEFALLADGVAIGHLYPLDLARAFASLDRILPSVTLWWEQGAQPVQILTSGDVDMVSAWHSRIDRIVRDGADVAVQWNGGALSADSWVVPKGAPNRDVAMDFINFATRPEVCAAFSSLVPFGPVNRQAFDLIPAEIADRLPTAPQHKDVQFTIDFEWWFKHREATEAEFEEWLSEHP